MEKTVRLFADAVGEIRFDGVCAVASALDLKYPEIRRVTSKSAAPLGVKTKEVTLGESELVFEGFLLDRAAIDGGDGRGAKGALRLREKLCAIAAPGQPFTLAVGDRRRSLFAKKLSFDALAPFGTGLAEKFTLTAFSDDPYFHGGERRFIGTARTEAPLALPCAAPLSTGVMRCVGDVVVDNDGCETCGVRIEVNFTSTSQEFHLTSDRESGRMYMGRAFSAGDSLVINTKAGQISVEDGEGESLLSTVGETCAFFHAPPGRTRFTWNSFSADSPTVEICITPGYLGV